MTQSIIDIINEIKNDKFLVADDVDMDLLSEYGIDSIELIEILVKLEKLYNVRFDISRLKGETISVRFLETRLKNLLIKQEGKFRE